jgi:hypothetical protein
MVWAFGSDNWCDVCEHDVSGASPGSAAYAQQLPFEQQRLFAAASASPSGRLLGTINGLGAYLHVLGSSRHLCV